VKRFIYSDLFELNHLLLNNVIGGPKYGIPFNVTPISLFSFQTALEIHWMRLLSCKMIKNVCHDLIVTPFLYKLHQCFSGLTV